MDTDDPSQRHAAAADARRAVHAYAGAFLAEDVADDVTAGVLEGSSKDAVTLLRATRAVVRSRAHVGEDVEVLVLVEDVDADRATIRAVLDLEDPELDDHLEALRDLVTHPEGRRAYGGPVEPDRPDTSEVVTQPDDPVANDDEPAPVARQVRRAADGVTWIVDESPAAPVVDDEPETETAEPLPDDVEVRATADVLALHVGDGPYGDDDHALVDVPAAELSSVVHAAIAGVDVELERRARVPTVDEWTDRGSTAYTDAEHHSANGSSPTSTREADEPAVAEAGVGERSEQATVDDDVVVLREDAATDGAADADDPAQVPRPRASGGAVLGVLAALLLVGIVWSVIADGAGTGDTAVGDQRALLDCPEAAPACVEAFGMVDRPADVGVPDATTTALSAGGPVLAWWQLDTPADTLPPDAVLAVRWTDTSSGEVMLVERVEPTGADAQHVALRLEPGAGAYRVDVVWDGLDVPPVAALHFSLG